MPYNYTTTALGGTGLSQIDETKPLGSEDPGTIDDVLRQTRAALKDVMLRIHTPTGELDDTKLNAVIAGIGGFVPTGGIIMWSTATVPTGYLECNGQAVSRLTYAPLFAKISIIYGAGDGSTTFNVPDMRGRKPIGAGVGPASYLGDTNPILTNRNVATAGGRETHALVTAELPVHDHTYNLRNTATDNKNGGGDTIVTPGGLSATSTSSVGNGDAHPNMDPWLCLKFIIRI